MRSLIENEISGVIVDKAYQIHTQLGPGLFESVYETILHHELISEGLVVEKQKIVPVEWKGIKMDQGFRADLVVEGKVIVEIKSIDSLADVHKKQLLTYLKLPGIKLGLLINFNEALIKNGIVRIVNNL